MKLTSIYSAVALSLLLATGAQAVEKNITVTASIDPTLDMAMADGTALPSNIDMR
ncbi:fimbrial protein, partial [Salmonella enterica]|nr:fimbrial protein [Salmonella enterica]